MCHHVEDDVDGQGIRHALGKRVKIARVLALPLPSVTVVAVVQRENHQPTFVVEDRAMMNLLTVRPALPSRRSGSEIAESDVDARDLVLLLDWKETVVDRVVEREFDEAVPRQDMLHNRCKMIPLSISPEI